MDDIKYEVHGLKELDDALGELDTKAAGKALRGALMNATLPTLKRSKELAPVDPYDTDGHIRDAMGRRTKIQKNGIVKMRLGERDKAPKLSESYVPHGQWLEFGTKFMAARPFLRPAFDSTVDQILERFGKRLRENIEKVRAK